MSMCQNFGVASNVKIIEIKVFKIFGFGVWVWGLIWDSGDGLGFGNFGKIKNTK